MSSTTGLILIIVIIAVIWMLADRRRNTKMIATRQRYQDALARLRRQPSDTAIYAHTQQLGREIIALIGKGQHTNTPFTEATLQNDLDSATRV